MGRGGGGGLDMPVLFLFVQTITNSFTKSVIQKFNFGGKSISRGKIHVFFSEFDSKRRWIETP